MYLINATSEYFVCDLEGWKFVLKLMKDTLTSYDLNDPVLLRNKENTATSAIHIEQPSYQGKMTETIKE